VPRGSFLSSTASKRFGLAPRQTFTTMAVMHRFCLLASLILLPLAFLLCGGPAQAAQLVVTIDGLHSAKGNLFVALYSRAEGFPDGDYSDRHTKIPASLAPLTVIFDDLPPGTYAVGAYHDENANNKLDTNLLGYPIEGYALSNGVRAIILRPRFADAAFAVGSEGKQVTLRIKY
jgi:uncharacterized protein (DUF2141 family)